MNNFLKQGIERLSNETIRFQEEYNKLKHPEFIWVYNKERDRALKQDIRTPHQVKIDNRRRNQLKAWIKFNVNRISNYQSWQLERSIR